MIDKKRPAATPVDAIVRRVGPAMGQHPWDAARRKQLRRIWPTTGEKQKIDRGCNFFILALESLGAKTVASCEGHPFGFYVLFDAPYDLALRIRAAGFFEVEV